MIRAEALSALLQSRYSCRAFRADPVPTAVIAEIVEDAGRAPSWCNAQPWGVTVTQGAATARFRDTLLETVKTAKPEPDMPWPEDYPGVYGERRRECGFQLYEAVGIAREDRASRAVQSMRNFELFDAPHVALLHAEARLGPYGALDCGGFLTAFLLAAEARGVATIAQASVAAYPGMIRAHFGLAETRHILCAVSFGYADPDAPINAFRTTRARLEDVLDLRDA